MRLRSNDIEKLEAFLRRVRQQVYPEALTALPSAITERMWRECAKHIRLPEAARVLDIGCGQGVALHVFRLAGLRPVGISLSEVGVRICREQGREAHEMDEFFLDFPSGAFDSSGAGNAWRTACSPCSP